MATQSVDAESTRRAVAEYYGARVRKGDDCCGSDCCGGSGQDANAVTLYGDVDLVDIPLEASANSFGCGNPTAIAGLQPGEVVVDLGSGGGLDVLLAARQVGPQGFVYGVDMTDEMLALAERNRTQAGVTNAAFRKGHIEDLPLPDNCADVIISNCVINLSPDKGQTLHEAFRVLRPGGRLAVSDIVIDGDLFDLPVSEEQVRAALSWAGCIAGALTINQYRTLLAEAGFTDIHIDIRQRYDADMLAQAEGLDLPTDLVARLAGRFTSSCFHAVKP